MGSHSLKILFVTSRDQSAEAGSRKAVAADSERRCCRVNYPVKKRMDNLKTWLIPLLDRLGCKLYDVEWDKSMKPPVLRISIEKKDGTIDLDTCALASDAISTELDTRDEIDGEYMLEVCSPGAERELRNDEEIAGALGKHVYVKFKNPVNGLNDVTGDLSSVEDEVLTVRYFDKGRPRKAEVSKDNIALIMTAVKM